MTRAVNLLSLLDAKETLSDNAFTDFKILHGVSIKDSELTDLRIFCEDMAQNGLGAVEFENFYVGYKIPQIGKEFDLLRFDNAAIVNIEIKRNSDAAKILAQLTRNSYYLSFINREVCHFTYLSETKEFFSLDSDNNLCTVPADAVAKAILKVATHHEENINSIFNPCDYLVSPFNSPERFIEGKYFLTGHQEEIVKSIMAKIKNGHSFSSVSGGPGTGKSLLAYSLAKTAMASGHSVLIIHCGNLNTGQDQLNAAGYSVIPVKKTSEHKDEAYDLIIVDEAQRIREEQFKMVIEKSKKDNIPCVFSHDGRQTLAQFEKRNGISKRLKAASNVTKYELSDKIRSNAEISDFIKAFLNKNRAKEVNCGPNIRVSFFSDTERAFDYWRNLPSSTWKRLRLTPSRLDHEHHEKFYQGEGETSHNVIGQEFDGVAIMIDDMFAYDDNGALIYREKSYYDPVSMIFQNITRTRKRLNVVIVRNEEIMEHCLSLLAEPRTR